MEIREYINKKKNLYVKLLEFLDDENNKEENYQNLMKILEDQKIKEDFREFKSTLHLINKISNNHNRSENFFSKIEKIFMIFKETIKKYFTSYDIFRIFNDNKRVLLFLFNEKIVIPDKNIVTIMSRNKYKKANYFMYFQPEIKTFKNEAIPQKQIDFDEKRKIGENDEDVCELIRKDSIEEFITFVNQRNLSLNTTIERSLFETNSFLYKKRPTLIEYSAFFGSIQIFKYLNLNGVELTPSIWLYSIHGCHPEMIHYLEVKKIQCPTDSLKEAIKCHHNEIANYLLTNVFKNASVLEFCIKYYNYNFMPDSIDLNNENIFYNLCKYDYIYLVSSMLNTTKIVINKKYVSECSEENDLHLMNYDTPLKIAAVKENVEIIDLLVAQDQIVIEGNTFKSCLSLTQITISPSVKSIYSNTFYGCSSLIKVNLPSTLTLIGECAFKGCSSLKEICILTPKDSNDEESIKESSLISLITKPFERSINDEAFKGCSSLIQISISSSVSSIGKSSFANCIALEKVASTSKVTIVDENAFKGCTSLKIFSTSFPMTLIENNAFEGCSSLEKIIDASQVSKKVDEKVAIPSSISSIGKNAFEGCFSIKQVTLPSSLKTIGSFAFHGCLSITQMFIPSSIIDVGDSAFYGCSSLTRLAIPSYINEIKTFCFRECSSLKFVTIPSFVTTIGYAAFYGCSSLKKVVVPNSVTEIGYCAFAMCTSLKKISIPYSVTSIGGSAFEGCSSVVQLSIPSSVVSIGDNAFKDCSSLEQIELPLSFDSTLPLGILPNVNVIYI